MTRKLLPASLVAASAGALMLVAAACGSVAPAPKVQLGSTGTTTQVQPSAQAASALAVQQRTDSSTAPAQPVAGDSSATGEQNQTSEAGNEAAAAASASAPADAALASTAAGTGGATSAAAAAGTAAASTTAPADAASANPATGIGDGASAAAESPAGQGSGALTIALNSSDAKAEYQTQEQLAGRNLPNLAGGKTTAISGSIVLANGQLDASASKITVDLSTLASDESMRDNFIKGNTLQTSKYPDAVFVPTTISGLPATLPTNGAASFQLGGNLTVHGVTKPITWTVNATFANGQASGKATAPFTITEFGMSLPKAGPVLSVQDAGTLELDFSNAALSAAA